MRRSCNSQSFLPINCSWRTGTQGLWLTNCLAGGLYDGDWSSTRLLAVRGRKKRKQGEDNALVGKNMQHGSMLRTVVHDTSIYWWPDDTSGLCFQLVVVLSLVTSSGGPSVLEEGCIALSASSRCGWLAQLQVIGKEPKAYLYNPEYAHREGLRTGLQQRATQAAGPTSLNGGQVPVWCGSRWCKNIWHWWILKTPEVILWRFLHATPVFYMKNDPVFGGRQSWPFCQIASFKGLHQCCNCCMRF